jgi:hypothetical protein
MPAKNVIIGVVALSFVVPAASPLSMPMAPSVSAQVRAPGNPFTDCNYERPIAVQLARGLFGLDERIARTQRWLDGATRSARHLDGEAQRMMTNARNDLAVDVGFTTLKANAVRAALRSLPASPSLNLTRDLLFKDLDHLEFLNNLVKGALAVGNFQVAKQEAARMASQVSNMEMASLTARALTDANVTAMLAGKVGGPIAELSLTVGVMAIDTIEAAWAADITANEIADAKQTLEILNDQKSKIMQQVEKVVADCGRENQTTENRPADSPQPTPPPDAVGPAPSGGGISGGAIAGIIAAGASIPIGVWAYEEYKKTLADGGTGGGNTGGGNTGGGGSIATTISAANITCTLGSAGSLTHCTGTLTARIGPSVTAGVRVTAHTDPVNIQGHATPTSTGAGQTLVFTFTNVTGVGCQALRTVRFTRQTDPNTAFTSWTGTIPITCR